MTNITLNLIPLLCSFCLFILITALFLYSAWGHATHRRSLQTLKEDSIDRFGQLTQTLERRLGENLLEQAKITGEMQRILSEALSRNSQESTTWFKDLSLLLEKRLNEGFEKTTSTFTDIVKRLALIDDAQKKLTELSSNVVSLQEILVDKRSRGAFGEVQLQNLVQNMLPANHFAFQHTLSNGNRADCILFLPEPTGNVVIDSKFPLENFQIMTDFSIKIMTAII